MVQHTRRRVAAALAVSLTAVIGTAEVSRAADDCLTKPNALAPQGSHWYYRIDRTTHRQCWFLGAEGAFAARQDSLPVRPRASTKPQAAAQTITADATNEGPLPAKVAPVKPQAPAQAITTDATGDRPLAAKAVPVEILVGQAKPSEDNSTAEVTSWAAIPPPTLAIDTGSAAMRNSSAEEHSTKGPQAEEQGTKDSEEEMPLIWPILSDEELSTVARPPDSPISFALCAALAVFLGLAAMTGRLIFKPSARRGPNQSSSARQAQAVGTHRRNRHVPPTFARTTAAARQARMTCRPGKVSAPPSGSMANLEPSVRRLLHELEWRRLAHERRASEPSLRKTVT
jgi:hypothetical protein